MWLAPAQRSYPGPSAHQFALFRIALGIGCLFVLGAGLGSDATGAWLAWPRGVRTAVRAWGVLSSTGLMLGAFRRASALAAIIAALGAVVLDLLPWFVVSPLVLLCGLVAYPSLQDEPWALGPTSGMADAELDLHFTTAAWATYALSLTATLFAVCAEANLPLALLAGLVLFAGLGWIAVRGPSRAPVLSLLALGVLVQLVATRSVAGFCWYLPAVISLVSCDWLPPRAAGQVPTIVFFDGLCGLCQRSVQLIVREDRLQRLQLAPLQGPTAQKLLGQALTTAPETMLVREGEQVFRESDAALRVAANLGGVWALLLPLRGLPSGPRDALYRWVAAHRYDWFGRLDACPVPSESVRARFLP